MWSFSGTRDDTFSMILHLLKPKGGGGSSIIFKDGRWKCRKSYSYIGNKEIFEEKYSPLVGNYVKMVRIIIKKS